MFKRILIAFVVLAAIAAEIGIVKQLSREERTSHNAFPGTGTDKQLVAHSPSSLPPVGSTTDQIWYPRFKVEMISITAVDETGWEWTGFDEIFAVYDTRQHRIATSAYLMNSGEVLQFPVPGVESVEGALAGDPHEFCIWPVVDTEGKGWDCVAEGGAAPVAFAVSLWEYDNQVAFGGLGFCVGGYGVRPAGENIPCIDYHEYLFSTPIYSYSEAELLQELPAPFDSMFLEYGWVQHYWDSSFEYHVKIRVMRVADEIEERPRDLDPTPE